MKSVSLMLAFVCFATLAFAQAYSLDDAKGDATAIVVQSSQIKGKVTTLVQMMNNGNANNNQINNKLADLDQSFRALESQAYSMNSGILSLSNNRINDYEVLTTRSVILIRHMMLVADDKSSFRTTGDQGSGNSLRNGLQELKNLAQDIRQEVTTIKNR